MIAQMELVKTEKTEIGVPDVISLPTSDTIP